MSVSLLEQKNLPLLLCRIVEGKLNASGALNFVKRAGFGSNPLQLSSENSLLLEFQGPVIDTKFRMLVSFLQIDLLDLEKQTLIARCRDLLWFDLAVFWTTKSFVISEIQSLKGIGVHTLTVLPPDKVGSPFQQIPDFIHTPNLPYDQLLELNFLANEIVKRLRKKFHLVLSELAADSYDDYGTFATKQVMAFEDKILKSSLKEQFNGNRGELAIDVGCGNGRHTRLLAKHFSEVVAFDLSKRMINAAREKDRKLRQNNDSQVNYYECDVEYEEFPDENSLSGKADFVCASFGMPSFVEDTAAMLRRFYKWLKPSGKILFTFYNSQSVALTVNTPWKERSLSASIDLARNALDVELRDGVRFSIYCKPLDARLMEMIRAYFRIEKSVSFPHLLSLLPPNIFGTDDKPQMVSRQVFPHIDQVISADGELMQGHYVFLIAKKEHAPREGYLRVLSAIQKYDIEYEVIEHQAVVSTKEISQLLSLSPSSMVKTVIFQTINKSQYFVTLVPPTRQVDLDKLAYAGDVEKSQIILASPVDVEKDFGFPIGGVPPLGFEELPNVSIFVEETLKLTQDEYIYMGIGDNTKTLKLLRQDFLRIIMNYSEKSLIFTQEEN